MPLPAVRCVTWGCELNVKELRCPSCAAALAIDEDSTLVQCEYCGVTSAIERPEGQTILRVVDEVVGTIKQSSDETQEAIMASSTALADQMKVLERRDRLMAARIRLMSLDNDIRALEVAKSSRRNRRQIAALNEQRELVAWEITLLEKALSPHLSPYQRLFARLVANGWVPKGLEAQYGILVWVFCLLRYCRSAQICLDQDHRHRIANLELQQV